MQQIESYLRQIRLALISSPVVADYEIVRQWAHSDDGYIRVRITLTNNDFLEATMYVISMGGEITINDYRYQWMSPDKKTLRRRWDNAPHHLALATFPHHVHDGSEGNIVESELLSLPALLDLLEATLL